MVTAKLLYNFLTAFFPLNRVIAKTRKVRSRITRDACINYTEVKYNLYFDEAAFATPQPTTGKIYREVQNEGKVGARSGRGWVYGITRNVPGV